MQSGGATTAPTASRVGPAGACVSAHMLVWVPCARCVCARTSACGLGVRACRCACVRPLPPRALSLPLSVCVRAWGPACAEPARIRAPCPRSRLRPLRVRVFICAGVRASETGGRTGAKPLRSSARWVPPISRTCNSACCVTRPQRNTLCGAEPSCFASSCSVLYVVAASHPASERELVLGRRLAADA